MRRFRIYQFVYLLTLLVLMSCSKTGPIGPQGDPGPKGDAGVQGIAGADGSTIYSGTDAPSADLGKKGDFYLDKSSGNIYGPKTETSWGTPVSLKGSAGQNGRDGNQILSGTTVPAFGTGNPGDFYLNTSTLTLYGPKSAAGWGSGLALHGPKGDQGEPGTANVLYSAWMAFDWTSYGPFSARKIIRNDHLTRAFMDSGGMVMVYVRVLAEPLGYRYFPLPSNFSNFYNSAMEYFIETKSTSLYVDLRPQGGTLTNQFTAGINDVALRYVLIPGGTHLRQSSIPDLNDYEATCAYYGILQ